MPLSFYVVTAKSSVEPHQISDYWDYFWSVTKFVAILADIAGNLEVFSEEGQLQD